MKVLHLITSLNNGGAEKVLYRLVSGDTENTHYVISLMKEGMYSALLTEHGIVVHHLNMPRGRITVNGLVCLFKLIKSLNPDLLQTWMYHPDLLGGVLAKIAGIKAIAWGIRGPYNKKKTSLSTKVVIWSCAFLSRWIPSAIISNSEHAITAHVNAGYMSERFLRIPNGYPILEYDIKGRQVRLLREKLGLETGYVVLGMVGRFDPYKDHKNLIQALNIVKSKGVSFKCLLVGDGMDDENSELMQVIHASSLNDKIVLLGSRSDIPVIMSLLDIHVLSSLAESFPNVLAEAMACGTPCVTTDVGDASLIIGDHGWLAPPEDPQSLSEGLLQACNEFSDNKEAWAQRQRQCRAHIVKNYSIDFMIESFKKTWRGIAYVQ